MSSTTEELVTSRKQVYGDPTETFIRIAQVWSGIADADINAHTVALMMIGAKLVRAELAPRYSDNSDDIEGYLEIFREIIGTDMVHARTVSEYLERRSYD